MDFYLVSEKFGWTWAEWQDTPGVVKTLCWTYLQMQNEAESDRARAVG